MTLALQDDEPLAAILDRQDDDRFKGLKRMSPYRTSKGRISKVIMLYQAQCGKLVTLQNCSR